MCARGWELQMRRPRTPWPTTHDDPRPSTHDDPRTMTHDPQPSTTLDPRRSTANPGSANGPRAKTPSARTGPPSQQKRAWSPALPVSELCWSPLRRLMLSRRLARLWSDTHTRRGGYLAWTRERKFAKSGAIVDIDNLAARQAAGSAAFARWGAAQIRPSLAVWLSCDLSSCRRPSIHERTAERHGGGRAARQQSARARRRRDNEKRPHCTLTRAHIRYYVGPTLRVR